MLDETNLVVQSNPLINSQYRLGEIEQKLLRVLISTISPNTEGLEKKYYQFTIQNFSDFLGHKDAEKLRVDMRRIAKRLRETSVKVIKSNGNTIETSWVASFEYPKNKGWIEFEISHKLEEELLKIKDQFTQYHLKNIAKLTGAHTVRIYELVLQYANTKTRKRIIGLEYLRTIFGLQSTEYSDTSNFIRRIIKPAYKEIITKTDISYEWRVIKESRKIVAIEFYNVQPKTRIPPSILSYIPKKHRENKHILTEIRRYIETHGPEYVIEKLYYIASRIPDNFADYLHSTLQNDYGAGYIPNQEELPGIKETIDFVPGTTFEFNGERYTFDGTGLKIGNRYMAIGQMKKYLKDGKLKIIES